MEPRDLSSHATYRPGRGIEEVAREHGRDPDEFVTLSSNENSLGPSPAASRVIESIADDVHLYPKASHTDLTTAIADLWDVTPDQIWLANGGDGALDYLARAILDPGDHVLVPSPGFSYYAMSARYHHGEVREYSISKASGFALTAETVLSAYDDERIVYLTSPHNPTGGCFSIAAIETIAEQTGEETLVVVDEAYGEFTDTPSAVSLLADRDDIAVLRSFSKAYGLAGCRLGYAIVPAGWAAAYTRVNTPFAASEVACRAGLAALEDHDHLSRSTELAKWSREYMTAQLETRTWESHSNFVLADVGDASSVVAKAEDRGILVRDCSSFGLPDCVRITCGTEPQTTRVVETLNEIL